MSLPLLVAIVAVGIALVIAAVHLSGGSKAAALEDQFHAERRFAEDFPDERAEGVRLTGSRATAFLTLKGGKVGIVQAVGGRFLTRIVTPSDVMALSRPDPMTLSVRLRDFTWPGGDFRFTGEGEAAEVFNMFDGLRHGGAQEMV